MYRASVADAPRIVRVAPAADSEANAAKAEGSGNTICFVCRLQDAEWAFDALRQAPTYRAVSVSSPTRA